MMNANEVLASLQSGNVLCVRDIPDTDEGNALLETLMSNPNVRQFTQRVSKRNGAHMVHLAWGK